MKLNIQRLALLSSVFLLFLVLILNFFVFQKSEEEEFAMDLERRIQWVDKQFDQDFVQILMDIGPNDTISFEKVGSMDLFNPIFFLDSELKLVFWSDFLFSLDFSALNLTQEYQVNKNSYGTFLIKTRKIKRFNKEYFLVQAYRLIWAGTLENDYLKTGPNPQIFENDKFILFPNPEDGKFQIKTEKGQPIFGINFNIGYQPLRKVDNPPLLIFIGSLFLLYFLISFNFLKIQWGKGYSWQTIGLGILILAAIRVLMVWLDFPNAFFDVPLFNPSYYASSWFNPSLGDLALNTICIGLILGLIIFQLLSISIKEAWIGLVRKEFLVFSVCFIPTIFFVLVWFISGDLIFNSQWVLDIRSIPSFDYFKGISFLILFLWGSFYVLFSLTLVGFFVKVGYSKSLLTPFLVPVSILCIGFFFLLGFWLGVAGIFHFVFLFSIIRFELYRNVFGFGLNTFLTFFYASLIVASMVGVSTFQAEKDRINLSKRNFVNQFFFGNDLMTEFFLGEIFSRIREDIFIQNRLSDPLLSKEPIESKIRKIYLGNYFDQFEVTVRIFSSSNRQLLGPNGRSDFGMLQRSFLKSDYVTGIKDLYFIKGNVKDIENKFVAFLPIIKDNNLLGTIYLELDQLQVQAGSVYPKLLLDKKYASKLNPISFDYGLFESGNLIKSFGTFNYDQLDFKDKIDRNPLFFSGITSHGYDHLGVRNGAELVVVSSKIPTISQFFANISLFFVVFVLLTFLTILINTLFKGIKTYDFNYSTKLQLYLNFAFFFPIVIISIITISLLERSYRDDLNRQYIQKATLIQSNLESFFGEQQDFEFDRNQMEEEVSTLSKTISSDIHLYSEDGYFQVSNRSNIFEKKILARQINPVAFAGIKERKYSQFLVEEQIGNLNYQCVYLAIQSKSNKSLLAILAVPFFESETELYSIIADVLGNIFNAFVIIFIVFLIVSSFVTKNLTLPFRLLTQKIKTTNLENNEPMYWASKDEIGLLVKEYNNMLYKLEASKKVLASTEKETAWREMAKQVAHEIKNPLTPMKLTLQHLLRLEKEGGLEASDKLKKSLETLIHQVDALSGIASSFSTFAKMPHPKNEPMNFKVVLIKVLDLFFNDKRLLLDFRDDSYTEEIPIIGDDKLFGRIISNLIINGIQAVESGKTPKIRIWLWMSEQSVFLEITDNGQGIPFELHDKIFIPNFSTKSQGSGLGLSIAKSGVETAGGKIWFVTEEGKGTTFYLTFPLIQ